jgi:hypothetical protein
MGFGFTRRVRDGVRGIDGRFTSVTRRTTCRWSVVFIPAALQWVGGYLCF